jgi:hypothetical protein
VWVKGALACCFFLGSDGKRHCCKWAFPFVSSPDHRDLFEFKLHWAPSGSSCQMGDKAQSIQISTITVIFPKQHNWMSLLQISFSIPQLCIRVIRKVPRRNEGARTASFGILGHRSLNWEWKFYKRK